MPLIVFALSFACTDDGLSRFDDEFGETGGGAGVPGLGPDGPGCDANWYPFDGPPAEPHDDLPEFVPLAAAPRLQQRIDFSGPPPALGPEIRRPVSAGSTRPLKALEWEEFIAKFARPAEGGGWYVEGDLFRTREQLHDDYLAYVLRANNTVGSRTSNTLLGSNINGIDDVWSGPRKISLTWCVGWVRPSPNTPDAVELHAERYAQIVRSIEESARAWERVTNVNFVHLHEFDDPYTTLPKGGDCQPGHGGVFFRVRMDVANGCEGPCKGSTNATPRTELDPEYASPDNPDGWKRELIMSGSSLVTNSEAQTTARHELGHVLGFTHEHYRDDFPECPAVSIDWRELTPSDPKSVMAYDTCEGVPPNQPRLSAYDRLGAFYRYNWSRRQSLILGGASPIDDLSYGGSGRASIAWYDAKGAALHLWTSVATPGEVISFDVAQQCLDGGPAPCDTDVVWAHRVQPSPLFAAGTAADIDMLLYGPGNELDDILLSNGGPLPQSGGVDTSGYKVPVVGAFANGIADQVIFYSPGAGPDVLWDPESDANVSVAYADYAFPLPGRYRGFGGGASDILWYQPDSGTIEVWQWLDYGPDYGFLRQGPADASPHGLEAGSEYVPLVGDFDGDERTDIFWYAPGETTDSLWLSSSNQDVVIFDSYPHQVVGQYRGLVGDFNGDGIHDILWYSVAGELEGGVSGIWYFHADRGHSVKTFSVRGDYTPIVADFDDDGCSDVMWYDAVSDSSQSLIWRCVPTAFDFECEPPKDTPPQAFPIGYGGSF